MKEKRMLTLKEVGEIYGLSLSWLHKKSALRELGGLIKLGSKILIDIEEFEVWLRSYRVGKGMICFVLNAGVDRGNKNLILWIHKFFIGYLTSTYKLWVIWFQSCIMMREFHDF